jgi:hypothetical protein
MQKRAAVLLTALVAAALSRPALADPVTAGDLAGKTICWENSNFGSGKAVFGDGGKYSSTGMLTGTGQGTWAITSAGVKIDTDNRHDVDEMEKLSDGTFVSNAKIASAHIKSVGKVCE